MIGISSASPCCPVSAGVVHGSMRSRECPVLLSPLLDGVGRLFSSRHTRYTTSITSGFVISMEEFMQSNCPRAAILENTKGPVL